MGIIEHEVFFRLTRSNLLSDNSAIYPDLAANQLAPNPFVVPVLELDGTPPAMQHCLIAMALGHRIYRSESPDWLTLGVSSEPTRREWWLRLHHHRGLAIRLMNEDIGRQASRASNETITTVLVFLIGEVSRLTVIRCAQANAAFSRTATAVAGPLHHMETPRQRPGGPIRAAWRLWRAG